jgi:ABC-2 type transport system ATP-binding protein
LLTTHYLDEAEALADRVAVIARGKILEVSTPTQFGGRASAKARVQWKAGGVIQEEMTDNPTEVVRKLAAQFPGEVPELQVLRPSLEDIYLSMIGEK